MTVPWLKRNRVDWNDAWEILEREMMLLMPYKTVPPMNSRKARFDEARNGEVSCMLNTASCATKETLETCGQF
jgi:hypothetical protein